MERTGVVHADGEVAAERNRLDIVVDMSHSNGGRSRSHDRRGQPRDWFRPLSGVPRQRNKTDARGPIDAAPSPA